MRRALKALRDAIVIVLITAILLGLAEFAFRHIPEGAQSLLRQAGMRSELRLRLDDVRNVELTRALKDSKWADFVPPNDSIRESVPNTVKGKVSGEFHKRLPNTHLEIFLPNTRVKVRKETEDSRVIIYDVTYSSDDHMRRVTPDSRPSPEKQNLVLAGCSFTYGVGLNDDETLSNQVARLRPDLNVYNLGMGSAGPNDVLLDMINYPQRYQGFEGKSGSFVYVGIADHLMRNACTMACLRESNSWMLPKPNFQFDENGKLRNLGSFADSRPFLNPVYAFLAKSKLLEALRIDLPPQDSRFLLEHFARVINEIKTRAEAMNLNFYFTYYPGNDPKYYSDVFAALKKFHIQILDYTQVDPYGITNGKANIVGDGHPNPLSTFLAAQLLAKDIPGPLKQDVVSQAGSSRKSTH